MDILKSMKLEVNNLSKTYNGTYILDNISFNLYDGEFLSVIGSSGCGKTTLLKILVGLVSPDSGEIIKNGENIINSHPSERGMGVVFQNYALFENMTVFENIEYAMKIKPEFKHNSKDITMDLIKKMNLNNQINKKPYMLSGGQQQRVAIARTLALKPDIILLDEPMSALDVDTRIKLRAEIKEIQKDYGTTMIYITHDQEEAFSMGDRIMVMKEGKIEQIDTPANIIKYPNSEYIETFIIENLRLKIESIYKYVRF